MSRPVPPDRRPIRLRGSRLASAAAAALARAGVSPNAISLASVGFAAVGAAALVAAGPWLWLAAAMVQMRLLCNLLDGMVAVEHGRQTPAGAVFNEFPDRVADSLFLVAAGYAAQLPALGWAAALLAALTAYVRVFGASCGLPHDFRGPLAKPQRMALLTLGCLLQAALPAHAQILQGTVLLIVAGSALTCVTRTAALMRALQDPAR